MTVKLDMFCCQLEVFKFSCKNREFYSAENLSQLSKDLQQHT